MSNITKEYEQELKETSKEHTYLIIMGVAFIALFMTLQYFGVNIQ